MRDRSAEAVGTDHGVPKATIASPMTREEHSEPRVGARFDDRAASRSIAAARNAAAVQFGPQLIFGDAGLSAAYLAHRGLHATIAGACIESRRAI
jgi:hypothetical protein